MINQADDPVHFSVSRSVLTKLVTASSALLGRMHQLLEKNTHGQLCEMEKVELEILVRMAELGQIVAMALEVAPVR